MIEPENMRETIDKLVSLWGGIVVPFYGQVNSKVKLDGIGSGFLVEYQGAIFLVTCGHVIEDLNRTSGAVGYFNGKGIELSKLSFFGNFSEDVVVAHLDQQWAREHNLEKVKAFPLIKDISGYEESGDYFFMGYPCSRNKLKKNLNKFDRFLQSYSICEKLNKSSSTAIEEHTAFIFDINSMSNTQGESKVPPKLSGVSGGPLFSVLRAKSDGIFQGFALNLVGVFSEWRKKEKEIVCTNKSVVIESTNHWLV